MGKETEYPQYTSEYVEQLKRELQQARDEADSLKSRCFKWWDILSRNEPLMPLRWLISKIPVVVWAIDQDGILRLSEGKSLENLGFIPGEAVGLSVFDLYADHPQVISAMQRVLSGEQFTEEIVLNDNYFEVQFVPLHDAASEISGAVGLALEITRRRRAELALARNEDFYKDLFEALPIAVITATPQYKITGMNRFAEKLFGYDKNDLTGSLTEILYSDHCSFIKLGKKQARAEGLMKENLTLKRSDGSEFPSESICSKITDHNGLIKGLIGIHRDITEEQKIAKLKYWHEKTLQAMMDASPVMALMLDSDFRIEYANMSFAKHLNTSPEQLVGVPTEQLLKEADILEKRHEKFRHALDSGKPLTFVDSRKGRWFEHHLAPIVIDNSAKRVAVFIHDITDRIKSEELERERIAQELHEVVSEILEHHHEEHGTIMDELRGRPLTKRENIVLKEIASGLSTKQIADKHAVSTKTIESQRLSIMRKLRLFTLVDLTKYAIREGLTDLETHHRSR